MRVSIGSVRPCWSAGTTSRCATVRSNFPWLCNASGAQLCNHTLGGRLGGSEGLSEHLPALERIANIRAEQNRQPRGHGAQGHQTGEAARRSLDQHEVGNPDPCVDLKLDSIVAPTRSPDAANDGSDELFLGVKTKALQDFNPQRALTASRPWPNGFRRPIPARYRARSNRLTFW